MPFELTNVPVSFQNFINDVLRQHLDEFLTTYLDDVLVFSSTLIEHKTHVRKTLKLLRVNGLHLKSKKCEFYQTRIEYLGFIVFEQEIFMDPKKVKAIEK